MPAFISKTFIAQMALGHVGAKTTLENFDEASVNGRAIRLWYEVSRWMTLEGFNWSFARKRAVLALSGDAPPVSWAFRYVYPADCVAAREIENPYNGSLANCRVPAGARIGIDTDAIPFELETSNGVKTILTNMPTATLIYTYDLQDVTLYSLLCAQSLSLLLAWHICPSLTGDAKRRDQLQKDYSASLMKAPAENANEHVEKPPRDAEWVRGRA